MKKITLDNQTMNIALINTPIPVEVSYRDVSIEASTLLTWRHDTLPEFVFSRERHT